MKRVLYAAVVIVSVVATMATPADAAPPTAADFAADCNDDGVVSIDGTQRYVGGSGALTRICTPALTPGSTVVLRDVDLTGPGLAFIGSPENTTVRVVGSNIDMSGPLELTAGCCAGESWEVNGRVVVRNSALRGSSVQLMSSFDAVDGTVVVRDSTVIATGSLGIQIRASDLGGSDGLVRVVDSSLTSAGDLQITTGADGRTVVRRTTSSVAGTATVAAGPGGTCVSSANTPPIPCT